MVACSIGGSARQDNQQEDDFVVTDGIASRVIPFSDYGSASRHLMNAPEYVAVHDDLFSVRDYINHRVLLYGEIPQVNGAGADHVIGQDDCTTPLANGGSTPDASTLHSPNDVWTDETRIVVADSMNNRVLLWNSWLMGNGAAADFVLGRDTFTGNSVNTGGVPDADTLSNPSGIAVDEVHDILYVADTGNNRVVGYSQWPVSNGPSVIFDIRISNITEQKLCK